MTGGSPADNLKKMRQNVGSWTLLPLIFLSFFSFLGFGIESFPDFYEALLTCTCCSTSQMTSLRVSSSNGNWQVC